LYGDKRLGSWVYHIPLLSPKDAFFVIGIFLSDTSKSTVGKKESQQSVVQKRVLTVPQAINLIQVQSCAITPNSLKVVSGSKDNTLKV
jgi:hypothetical protein